MVRLDEGRYCRRRVDGGPSGVQGKYKSGSPFSTREWTEGKLEREGPVVGPDRHRKESLDPCSNRLVV